MSINDLFADGKKPNIILIITDQERSIATWPASYQPVLAAKLPAMAALMANGLTFENAFTGACMCSPSRATFLTSVYPVVSGCTQTGASVLPLPTYTPQFPNFPGGLPNLATVLGAAGYDCYWIGKWHLLGPGVPGMDGYPAIPAEPGTTTSDLVPWGFQTWDPDDAGLNLGSTRLGGGTQGPTSTNRNDQRYVADAQAFLASPPDGPFCLVVSLVNPHDIHLGYEGSAPKFYDASTYEATDAPIPANVDEDLSTKPRAQAGYTWAAMSPPAGASQQGFIDLYAYLIEYVDGQIKQILGAMTSTLLDETLIIRFADHGELGLGHGLVEKFDNAYDEAIHVPLVFSNPVACPTAQTTQALASTADLVPTLASLLGVTGFTGFVGYDLSEVLADPTSPGQDYIHYTFDDIPGPGPSVIRTIRDTQWMYSVYMQSTSNGNAGDWEMYDLTADPAQDDNLAGDPAYGDQQQTLDEALQAQMAAKGTAPSFTWPPTYVAGTSRGGPPASTEARDYPIDRISGFDERAVRTLLYGGISTTAQLAALGSPEGRAQLAARLGVDGETASAWVDRAELLRVPGVGPQQVALLREAGAGTLAALREANAEALAARIHAAAEGARAAGRPLLVGAPPAAASVARWIMRARDAGAG